jgi:hypothetical protein
MGKILGTEGFSWIYSMGCSIGQKEKGQPKLVKVAIF